MDLERSTAPNQPPTSPAEGISFATFTSLVLMLSTWARNHAMQPPQYRSPPRTLGVTRSLRRSSGGRPVISIRLRGRARSEVVRDMVDGLLAVNPEPGPVRGVPPSAARVRLREAAVEHLLTSSDERPATPLHGAGPRSVRPLAA